MSAFKYQWNQTIDVGTAGLLSKQWTSIRHILSLLVTANACVHVTAYVAVRRSLSTTYTAVVLGLLLRQYVSYQFGVWAGCNDIEAWNNIEKVPYYFSRSPANFRAKQDAQSLTQHRGGVLLFVEVIHLISTSYRPNPKKNERFESNLGNITRSVTAIKSLRFFFIFDFRNLICTDFHYGHGCLEYVGMGLLQDTKYCGLRMRRECRERFPRHRELAILTCITACAWRTCRDVCRDR